MVDVCRAFIEYYPQCVHFLFAGKGKKCQVTGIKADGNLKEIYTKGKTSEILAQIQLEGTPTNTPIIVYSNRLVGE